MILLFDLDGTLTDPFVGITTCIRHALTALGRPAPPADQLRWCIGPPLRDSLATLLGPDHSHRAEEALAVYRDRFGRVGLFENQAYPGIREALAGLQERGHVLRVATSKPAVFARRIIEHFDLARYFTSVDGCELDGTRGDKRSLIAYILREYGLTPGETLMIGDREHDVIGARENGVAAIGVLWGFGSREELEAAGALRLVATPEGLVDSV